MLAGHLSYAISRGGQQALLLLQGNIGIIPINSRTGGKHHVLHAAHATALQNIEQAKQIHGAILIRMLQGIRHHGLGRQMNYSIEMLLQKKARQILVAHVSLNQAYLARHMLFATAGKVIINHYLHLLLPL